jgi:hypothetical protein
MVEVQVARLGVECERGSKNSLRSSFVSSLDIGVELRLSLWVIEYIAIRYGKVDEVTFD